MIIERSIDISAPPDQIWSVLADVERWPEWTPSVTAVQRLDPVELSLNARVRIKQPRLPPLIWRVTALDPGRSFDWITSSPGATTLGRHQVQARDGGSVVRLSVTQTGLLGSVVGRLLAKLFRRYVEMEAQGLKRRAEARVENRPR